MPNDAEHAPDPAPLTLAIDIGGSHLKAAVLSATGAVIGEPVRLDTPAPATPQAVMAALAEMIGPLPKADRISAGFPGVVRAGHIVTAPNLGTSSWHGYPLAAELSKAFGGPARVLNDATVQGLGVISNRGLECVITLGTGMGFALFQDGHLTPHLELSQHPVHGKKIYDAYVGDDAREKIGNKRWNKHVARILPLLRTLTNFDTLLIGGGNAKYLHLDLPSGVHIVSNLAGISGGLKLWNPILDADF